MVSMSLKNSTSNDLLVQNKKVSFDLFVLWEILYDQRILNLVWKKYPFFQTSLQKLEKECYTTKKSSCKFY